LDPANDALPYECAVDVSDLITLTDVMAEFDLGPNGGLVYCMEYLEKNIDWLKERLVPLESNTPLSSIAILRSSCDVVCIIEKYILFDFPGQVELFTHHQSCRNILQQFQKWKYQPAAVHLVDAHHCSDAAKFVSVLLLSLSAMVTLRVLSPNELV
jgi:GTPase SAR1 family protein